MSYLDAVLLADARRAGRAQRSSLLRHRHLTARPLGMIFWQLGAEPFTAAAVAWGHDNREIVVAGEPRDRELAFRALTRTARAFNAWLEGGATRSGGEPPQVILPNRGNLTLLGRLGRRLAYLPLEGEGAADPELVRFGRHLRFLSEHARMPGQQLIVVLTDLLASHWTPELSAMEMQNLPALDAAIAPPSGLSAYEAVLRAETLEIGPFPSEKDDDVVDALMQALNTERNRGTDERILRRHLPKILAHYESLIDRGWPLLWRCIERERQFAAAASVARRWAEDVEALGRHIEWVVTKGGRYRTRATHEQAARKLRNWEEAQRLLEAEEAIDDALRMVPYVLSNDALFGKVVKIDLEHREQGPVNLVKRPTFTLELAEPCSMPLGKGLYWSRAPRTAEYVLSAVEAPKAGRPPRAVLTHQSGSPRVERPTVGSEVTFSIHHTHGSPPLMLPNARPWTHASASQVERSIEDGAGSWE